jgi:hypothetical protein
VTTIERKSGNLSIVVSSKGWRTEVFKATGLVVNERICTSSSSSVASSARVWTAAAEEEEEEDDEEEEVVGCFIAGYINRRAILSLSSFFFWDTSDIREEGNLVGVGIIEEEEPSDDLSK